jgi:hypothetical protein
MIVKVEALLRGGAVYTTVGVVHCETSSGVLNNVEQVKETPAGVVLNVVEQVTQRPAFVQIKCGAGERDQLHVLNVVEQVRETSWGGPQTL